MLYASFNSTLVQLKEGALLKQNLSAMFQFYLSSIKRLWLLNLIKMKNKFQFYLSSIKSSFSGYIAGGGVMFQFYLSSIKSQKILDNLPEYCMFQFYLSSIKRIAQRFKDIAKT